MFKRFTLGFLLLLLTGCGGAVVRGTAVPLTTITPPGFDRQALLENITHQIAIPAHEVFVARAEVLATAVAAFTANLTPETLVLAQDAWRAATVARTSLLTFRVGLVDDSLLHNRLDNRPARTTFIEETIGGTVSIDDAYIESIGSSSIGLGAMEYLLFDPEGGNEAVLARYTTAENTDRRRAYLLAVAQNLPVKATALLQVWTPEGQNYAQAFIAADMDGGELQGSMNMVVNQMISDLEEMITARLGKPTGNTSNGQARPDLVESPFAFWSLPRIKATLGTMQAIYTGGDGLGFDDYLDFLAAKSADGEPLSQAIDAQFHTTLAAFDAIEGTLHTAVTDHPDQVNAAYEEVRTLLVLLKVDMANHLGVTLTFNDNDGD
ncbi:MAG: imelysin family protein [Anaerolineaceae bacterium]|nr:imelysin family protein [Anaerolineaceae bacterium]